jgi:hypothetical protein
MVTLKETSYRTMSKIKKLKKSEKPSFYEKKEKVKKN